MDQELVSYLNSNHLSFELSWRHRVKRGNCGFHSHPTLEIVYHAAGRGVSSLKTGERMPFKSGSAAIYPANTPHDQLNATSGEDICIHLWTHGNVPRMLNSCFYIPELSRYAKRELMLLSEIQADMPPMEKICFRHRAVALFVSLLNASQALAREQRQSPREVYAERAYEYIRANFRSIDSVAGVAGHIGVSHDYLRHIFSLQYKMSLKRWLMTMRLEKAKSLLIHSPLPQKAIAEQCGFDNERYFSTSFKKVFKISPGLFRRRG